MVSHGAHAIIAVTMYQDSFVTARPLDHKGKGSTVTRCHLEQSEASLKWPNDPSLCSR
jgi:hypothetical protein